MSKESFTNKPRLSHVCVMMTNRQETAEIISHCFTHSCCSVSHDSVCRITVTQLWEQSKYSTRTIKLAAQRCTTSPTSKLQVQLTHAERHQDSGSTKPEHVFVSSCWRVVCIKLLLIQTENREWAFHFKSNNIRRWFIVAMHNFAPNSRNQLCRQCACPSPPPPLQLERVVSCEVKYLVHVCRATGECCACAHLSSAYRKQLETVSWFLYSPQKPTRAVKVG